MSQKQHCRASASETVKTRSVSAPRSTSEVTRSPSDQMCCVYVLALFTQPPLKRSSAGRRAIFRRANNYYLPILGSHHSPSPTPLVGVILEMVVLVDSPRQPADKKGKALAEQVSTVTLLLLLSNRNVNRGMTASSTTDGRRHFIHPILLWRRAV